VKPFLAMTGELTLRGELLSIGGLKEKLLAAVRLGVKQVLVPDGNRKDSSGIPTEIRKDLKLKYFADVLPAINFALEKRTANK
ncbi:MAG: S16 family serine protease, partial [candidate division Zixibacteria bacterium]